MLYISSFAIITTFFSTCLYLVYVFLIIWVVSVKQFMITVFLFCHQIFDVLLKLGLRLVYFVAIFLSPSFKSCLMIMQLQSFIVTRCLPILFFLCHLCFFTKRILGHLSSLLYYNVYTFLLNVPLIVSWTVYLSVLFHI